MTFVNDDGGRAAAGYRGHTGDCVARSIAVASGRPYSEVYARLAAGNVDQRRGKHPRRAAGKRTASQGINTGRKWFRDYMAELGFTWSPCMGIGTGCKVHLLASELPPGRLVLALSKHYAAFVNGELHDTYDCSRGGTRCVYGYWSLASSERAQ